MDINQSTDIANRKKLQNFSLIMWAVFFTLDSSPLMHKTSFLLSRIYLFFSFVVCVFGMIVKESMPNLIPLRFSPILSSIGFSSYVLDLDPFLINCII